MAKTNVGEVSVDLTLDKSKYNKQLNATTQSTESAFSSSMKKVGAFIAGAFAVKKVVDFSKSCVQSASQVQSAFTGLNSIVQGTNNSLTEAQKFIKEYTSDGLVSINETATAYKNLLSRGYDTSQIEDVMTRLKDSAAFGRQASYDLGEAVVSATEGLKNENSILVDNAGVTKNVAKMWEEWADAHGKTTNDMTQAEKIQAEYNGIMKETRFQVGDAAAYTKTFSGQIQQLKFNFNQMTVAIGKVVAPLAQLFIPVINTAINTITRFFEKTQSVLKTFGLEMPDVVSKSSSGFSGMSESIEGTGDSAVNAAKKIKKAFGPMDEINVLSKNSSSSSDESNSGGSFVNTPTSETTETVGKTSSAFDNLIGRVKELKALFSDGFNSTFNIDFNSISKNLNKIKKGFIDIFTDKKVLNASNKWTNNLFLNLGKITGSIGTIGGSITESLVGSISTYLSQNSNRISNFIVDMFDISSRSGEIIGKLFETLGSISEVFKSDTAMQIGSDIISMFTNPFMSLTATFSNFVTDIYDCLVTPIVNNLDGIKLAIGNTLVAIEPITSTLSDIFTTFGDKVSEIYDNYLHPFFENIKIGVSDTFGKLLKVYNEYVVPFFTKVGEIVKNSWENHLKPLWNNLSEFIGEVILLIQNIWNNWLKPFVDWIIQNIIPKIMPVLSKIAEGFSSIYNTVVDVINGVITSLKGILQFINGVFSGDWSKAWNGIKNIFKGVVDSFVSIFKLPINSIISGINSFISGLNKIKVPDWVPGIGGKGFHINSIPYLAQGGWVKQNDPQLAIVGDNKREGEIITPESKIYDQVSKALKDNNTTTNKQIEIHLYHHYEDGRIIIQKINQSQIDAGEILLLT